MSIPVLIIGNKNYSSWSLRPFMALKMAGIPFTEEMIRFGEPRFTREVTKVSKAGQVPILLHNDLVINDSIAIIEYAAETWPTKGVWPKYIPARAMARSAAAEMHAGFRGLRSACPMNLRRPPKHPPSGITADIAKDVARLEQLWADCREAHGKDGPFLFGKFCARRRHVQHPWYHASKPSQSPSAPATRDYMDAVLNTSAFPGMERGQQGRDLDCA